MRGGAFIQHRELLENLNVNWTIKSDLLDFKFHFGFAEYNNDEI
jgi:hypothetical protein